MAGFFRAEAEAVSLGLEAQLIESRAKTLARLVLEVSAAYASPSSRGLWCGHAAALREPYDGLGQLSLEHLNDEGLLRNGAGS